MRRRRAAGRIPPHAARRVREGVATSVAGPEMWGAAAPTAARRRQAARQRCKRSSGRCRFGGRRRATRGRTRRTRPATWCAARRGRRSEAVAVATGTAARASSARPPAAAGHSTTARSAVPRRHRVAARRARPNLASRTSEP
eukprot:391905-Prymnesium_polylepis.1